MISIDMKSNETVDPMIRWLKGRDHENFVIGSFFGGRVQTIRENFPMIRTSLTPREISTVLWSRRMPKNSSSAPRFAMVPETFKGLRVVNERFVEDCHRLDVEVHVWVINSLEKMNDLSRMGVDGIVTDNPCLGTYHLG
jgi:glycerophosphoryl diester phosphodiesterase